jgi:hypothetical protein
MTTLQSTASDPDSIPCNDHPLAPHGFLRNASHNAGRYVCECEFFDSTNENPDNLTCEKIT